MSARVARRYARAFIELLQEKKSLGEAGRFLEFCDLVVGNEELSRLCANVTLSAEDKERVMTALAKKAGLPELAANFVRVLAHNNRLEALGQVKDAVAAQMDRAANIQAVALTTAVAPAESQLAAFGESMKKVLGTDIRVTTRTDPSILAGAIAQVGSLVYDGSVRARLTRLRAELVKEI
jgi:F-type H+-transporting ATPase subunit delta